MSRIMRTKEQARPATQRKSSDEAMEPEPVTGKKHPRDTMVTTKETKPCAFCLASFEMDTMKFNETWGFYHCRQCVDAGVDFCMLCGGDESLNCHDLHGICSACHRENAAEFFDEAGRCFPCQNSIGYIEPVAGSAAKEPAKKKAKTEKKAKKSKKAKKDEEEVIVVCPKCARSRSRTTNVDCAWCTSERQLYDITKKLAEEKKAKTEKKAKKSNGALKKKKSNKVGDEDKKKENEPEAPKPAAAPVTELDPAIKAQMIAELKAEYTKARDEAAEELRPMQCKMENLEYECHMAEENLNYLEENGTHNYADSSWTRRRGVEDEDQLRLFVDMATKGVYKHRNDVNPASLSELFENRDLVYDAYSVALEQVPQWFRDKYPNTVDMLD